MDYIALRAKKKAFVFVLCLFIFAAFPLFADAAKLYIDPTKGEYQPGDEFIANVRLDTEGGECINSAEVHISLSGGRLQISDAAIGESIFTLWVQKPIVDNEAGTVAFTGGIPGGYCGRVSGDPGTSNILAQIILKAPGFSIGKKSEGNITKIEFGADTKVLLNDGAGTPAVFTAKGAEFTVLESATSGKPEVDEWYTTLKKDETQPESFTVEIRSEKNVFDGKYFVAFSTTDKQTGIDHFEVQEIGFAQMARGEQEQAVWYVAESPYLLRDQSLQSFIKVKAIDKAGNERVVELTPLAPKIAERKSKMSLWAGPSIVAGVGALAGILLYRRYLKGISRKV